MKRVERGILRLTVLAAVSSTLFTGLCRESLSAPSSAPALKHAGSKQGTTPLQIRDKWAVLIGVTSPKQSGIGQITTAARNVHTLAKCLRSEAAGKFAADHVVVLTDAQATTADIHSAVLDDYLCKKALPNDLIVLYLCGRVIPSNDQSDAVFCSYDVDRAQLSSTGVPLKRLLADLHSRTQSKQIICFLDTSAADQGAALNAQDLPKVEHIAEDCHIAVLSANQLFTPFHEEVPGLTSPFCHFVTDGIEAGGGQMPLSAVADYVAQSVQNSAYKGQRPIFVMPRDNTSIGAIALGCSTKVGSIKKIEFGHPMDTLALKRPDLVETRSHARDAAQADEDDDDAPAPNVDMRSYMSKMQKDIQAKWKPPKGFEERRIVTIFSIRRDGSIFEPQIVQGSGVEAVDKSALDALQVASPLDPLPAGSPKSVQVQYKFDWHMSHQ